MCGEVIVLAARLFYILATLRLPLLLLLLLFSTT